MRWSLIVVVALSLVAPSASSANGVGGSSAMGKAKASDRPTMIDSAPSAMPSSIRALKERIIDIQNRSPLMIADFTLCRSVEGYASYVPFPNNTVTNAREIQFYFEPVNLFTSSVGGGYAISFSQDVLLLSNAGEVLYREPDFRTFTFKGNKPALDVYGANKLDITGLAPGEYIYKIVIRDLLNDATAEATLTFTIQ